mmetsp:Transcript_76759/g.248594  ORF Transcript_76759/g.248594 Transcript_76759/m.248594 type:complete len:259 (+) Transcript_76759:832-1608(+)
MVTQSAGPRRAPRVHAIEDGAELVLGGGAQLAHGDAASLLDAAPVEVVADVEHILRTLQRRPRVEGIRDQVLRPSVDTFGPGAPRYARCTLRLEAVLKLRFVAKQLAVALVPACPREDLGPRCVASRIGDDSGAVLPGLEGAVHASPIPDGKDVCGPLPFDDHRGSRPAVVREGRRRGAQASQVAHQTRGIVGDRKGALQLESMSRTCGRVPTTSVDALVVCAEEHAVTPPEARRSMSLICCSIAHRHWKRRGCSMRR